VAHLLAAIAALPTWGGQFRRLAISHKWPTLVVADLLAAILLVGFDLRGDARFQPH
jgi:hypothetical protein